MSRIVVERHDNNVPSIEAGYDRPLAYFFVDRNDPEGDYVGGVGLLGERPCPSPEAAEEYLVGLGVAPERAAEVRRLLTVHATLEYPASNVHVDLTEPGR